jgi:hypothetical protein
VVVLDDVLSGLDPKTVGVVMMRLFDREGGYFRQAGLSVVMATHSRRCIFPKRDMVLLTMA